MRLVSDIQLDRELCKRRGGLREYVGIAWSQVEPVRKFIGNWHIDAVCEHLEAVTRGEITRLVINIPPGTSKSLTCSVFWPSWTWTENPQTKWITASYSGIISRRDAIRARRLMESQWYQERWGYVWAPNEDDWSSIRYSNNRGGLRLSTTPGGGATGEHADYQLVDDPLKPMDAPGHKVDSAALAGTIEWWDETMTSRMTDAATARRVIIMQRLHEMDLAAHTLKDGGYEHLCLPMEAERRCVVHVKHRCSMPENAKGEVTEPTTLGFKDPRPEGGLLWPERFSEKVLKERHREMGPRATAAQDQQRPVPAGGGIFKREHVKFWKAFPRGRVEIIQSWDCAFKDLAESDYVVGQIWVRKGPDYYLVDQVRDQMGVSATCISILALSMKWKKARRKLIEDKANGPAVIDLLKKRVPALFPVNPQGGKIARANASEPLWAGGNVYLPDPEIAPWVHDFIEEVIAFNGDPGRKDDQVDAMTQALIYLHGKTTGDYKAAMANVGMLYG